MGVAGDHYHTGRGRKDRCKLVDQQEVAEVVDSEGGFEAVSGRVHGEPGLHSGIAHQRPHGGEPA
jgi:hypothetical protein